MTEARIYSNRDTSRTTDEGQHWAEVIVDAGQDTERVIYTTRFHTAPHPAINEAEKWMKANGVTEVDE